MKIARNVKVSSFFSVLVIFSFCDISLCSLVLLIGSSVDRYMIYDVCSHFNLSPILWGNKTISNPHTTVRLQQAAAICRSEHFNIASVQIFGSSPVGPYLHGYSNTSEKHFTDTVTRIPVILSLYIAQFERYPDRIIFSSAIWDCSVFTKEERMSNSPSWSNVTAKFYKDINERIDQISSYCRHKCRHRTKD